MGKPSRDKGKRVELICRDLLRRVYPGAYRTGDQRRAGGPKPPDVEGSPYWVEVKGGSTSGIASVWSALRQAEADRKEAHSPRRPILIYMRLDNTTPLVCQPADEWIEREAEIALLRGSK